MYNNFLSGNLFSLGLLEHLFPLYTDCSSSLIVMFVFISFYPLEFLTGYIVASNKKLSQLLIIVILMLIYFLLTELIPDRSANILSFIILGFVLRLCKYVLFAIVLKKSLG